MVYKSAGDPGLAWNVTLTCTGAVKDGMRPGMREARKAGLWLWEPESDVGECGLWRMAQP